MVFGSRRHFRELLHGSEEGIALGDWGLTTAAARPRGGCGPKLLRDGGSELVERFMDELRERHLGIPLLDPEQPRAGSQLRAAYEAAIGST